MEIEGTPVVVTLNAGTRDVSRVFGKMEDGCDFRNNFSLFKFGEIPIVMRLPNAKSVKVSASGVIHGVLETGDTFRISKKDI